ncbi:rhomboid family intramembrane serine protease [Natrarchaeobaculum aegyptiacum]|uniref:Rhomboid family intramembrane serine protease n=1 Tax=Natrarchaeobaculum aegyptiacum TaxID=745377 RepID=A0A2Z2HYF9_9EURY|nr:rhomboid family intramembrane serine protease [Natrarchaeobaculum aegyptiacum]ARS91395.1 rhomboid family intramembrane serine protease [Natrarchaeobaculum aegyptiacum]
MSIRSRSDSAASSSPNSSSPPGSASPILELLVVFAVVFVLYQAARFVGLFAGLFVLTPPVSNNPLSIVTNIYAHTDLTHLLSNSLALVVFGWPVAQATTRVRFHAFFLATGALAGISQVVLSSVLATMPVVGATATAVLGASGAVFALLGYLVASNRLSVSLASFVDVPRWVTILVFVGLATAVTLATAAPGVALVAHFTGLLLGLIAGRARILAVGSGRGSKQPAT